jgi:hypothetical protein
MAAEMGDESQGEYAVGKPMRRTLVRQRLVLAAIVLWIWPSAAAADPPSPTLFSVVAPAPRSFSALAMQPSPASIGPNVSLSLTVSPSQSTNGSVEEPIELSIQRFEAMNGTTLLLKPEFRSPPGGVAGFVQAKVFDPIVYPGTVKFRKFSITGGVVGAVKKKNPMYLLNPLFFGIDW